MYLEKYDLRSRVAVVTGGGQGIGFACAQALAEAGARVVIADINPTRIESARAELQGLGYEVLGKELDVTRSADVDRVAEAIRSELGPVAILVNNAGVARSFVPAEATSDEHWRFHMDVNLDGVFWCCRAFGRQMLDAGRGSIVNIGSMSGVIVNKPQEQAFYNASKAAVHHLTKSLAAEWAQRGVRVNAVAPTYIETPLTRGDLDANSPTVVGTWLAMTPMARIGQPEEIASAVLFLASDAASLLTGSIVLADGGYTCW